MNSTKNRTVGYGIEWAEDYISNVPHSYQLYYILGGRSFYSKEYISYQKAFDAAIMFTDKVLSTDRIPDDIKKKIIQSIQVLDVDSSTDVCTAELKNILLSKVKDI